MAPQPYHMAAVSGPAARRNPYARAQMLQALLSQGSTSRPIASNPVLSPTGGTPLHLLLLNNCCLEGDRRLLPSEGADEYGAIMLHVRREEQEEERAFRALVDRMWHEAHGGSGDKQVAATTTTNAVAGGPRQLGMFERHLLGFPDEPPAAPPMPSPRGPLKKEPSGHPIEVLVAARRLMLRTFGAGAWRQMGVPRGPVDFDSLACAENVTFEECMWMMVVDRKNAEAQRAARWAARWAEVKTALRAFFETITGRRRQPVQPMMMHLLLAHRRGGGGGGIGWEDDEVPRPPISMYEAMRGYAVPPRRKGAKCGGRGGGRGGKQAKVAVGKKAGAGGDGKGKAKPKAKGSRMVHSAVPPPVGGGRGQAKK